MEEKDNIDINTNEEQNIKNNNMTEDMPNINITIEREKTINSQIDPTYKEEERLMSLEEKLKLDIQVDKSFNKIDESMDLDILIYNIKDFVMMFILLLSSSFNFNYLYLPYIIIGLSYNFFILEIKNINRKTKFILELITFIYSILLLIFKIVMLILVSKNREFYSEENIKSIFINLGISYLLSEEKIYFISTFIGEALVLIFSLAGIIINKIMNITDDEVDSRYFKKLTYDKLFNIMRKYLYTCFFIISCVAIFNNSILSFIYIVPMFLLLFLYSIDLDKTIIYNLIRCFVSIILFLLIFEVIFINILNFYSIAHKYLISNDDNDDLTIWYQLGFYFIDYKNRKLEIFLNNWFGYFFSCLSLVTFRLCSKAISKHELQIAKKNEESNEDNVKKGILNIIYDQLAVIMLNPYFILHICRIMAIIWICIFRNFYSLGIFVWLFFSFLYLHISNNKFWVKFVLIPSVIITFFSIHISRIEGIFMMSDKIEKEKYFHFAIGKYYDYDDYLRYIFGIFFYFFTTYFLFTLNEFDKKVLSVPLPKFEPKNIIDNQNQEEEKENNKEKTLSFQINKININYFENIDNDLFGGGMNVDVDPNLENNLLLKEENDISDDKILDEKEMELVTFYNIIMKNVFENINIITLISLYLVAFNSANIIHLIFLLIFMIQLLLAESIHFICIWVIIIFQILYLIEYIMDLSKVYNYDNFKNINIIKKIKFCLPFNEKLEETSIEIFIYFVVYCFYIQYQLNNHKYYQQLIENENININNFINKKLSNYPFLKKVLFFIGFMFMNINIWVINLLFIFFVCYFEVNILFGIQLELFLISLYFLLLFIQDPKNKKLTLKTSKAILIYSGINTFVVYIYQIITYSFTDDEENTEESSNYILEILKYIGLIKIKENLFHLKLFRHFFINFLSILFLNETKRLIKINKKYLLQNYTKKLKTMKTQKEEKDKQNENSLEQNEENVKKESAAEKYKKNIDRMTILEIKNFFFHIIMIITKFYWLFLFMTVCILFTTSNFSYRMIIYIIIFGLTFILMFYNIIKNLSNFIQKDSYFISKVIRYSLIEVKSHIKNNAYSRKIAFQFLFGTNCSFLFIFYLSGVFYLFENDYKSQIKINDLIISLSYLFGFYVDHEDLKKSGILKAAWADLFLFCLIAFDVYIQKLENYFTELSVENRKEFKILANKNIKLRPLSLLGETNILANIEAGIITNELNKSRTLRPPSIKETLQKKDEVKQNKYERDNEVDIGHMTRNYYDYLEDKYKDLFECIENLLISKNIKLDDKDSYLGKRNIIQFLEIFKKASSSDVKLSETNNKYNIINGIKQVFEEIISFLLICTAISKLNIWSFIYMIFALFLILTKKYIKKYYFLFCFIIASIILQNIVFVSNINPKTDPLKQEDILKKIKDNLNIPWYMDYTDDKNGFFFGLGVHSKQINLMWMDYIEVIIIYIYLDFFSYSIYQVVKNKGKVYKGNDKINYYNLHLNSRVKKCVEILRPKEFNKHKLCMKTDFNIDIGEYEDFKNRILLLKPETELRDIKQEDTKKNYNTVYAPDIALKITEKDENQETEQKQDDDFHSLFSQDMNDKESPLLLALEKSKKLASAKKNLINKSMEKEDESTLLNAFKSVIYLSLHIIILIIIMIISMMVSGLLSIFYIIFSLYFLMKSNAIYVGDPYYYPHTIKTVLRVAILVDIAIQTLYQTPYINTSSETSKFNRILKIIGFNKIIYFGDDSKDLNISAEQMILVLAKAFTHFFISIQILIYSSQDFQEYYLSYLLTKNINLRRISLMNVFRFNNKRIQVMGKSIKLRQEMENSMIILQKRLESWTKALSSVGGKLYIGDNKESKKSEEKKDKEKDNKPRKKNVNFVSDIKPKSNLPENKPKDQVKNESKEEKNENNNFFDIFGIKIDKDNLEEEEEKEKGKNYVPEEIVKQKIKSWIFGSFLMKIQLWLHKNAASYTSIEPNERDVYEKEVIQGRTTISSMLETMVEMQLNILDLSKFTSDELREVKKYFDGTREKELQEMKKEKDKMEKIKKAANQVITLNQLKKEVDKNIEEKKDEQKDSSQDEQMKEGKENSEKKVDTKDNEDVNKTSIYEDVKLKEEENKKNLIDLTQPKFIELEKFTSNELFIKYLKTSYILKCIFTDIIAFCSNQFHWLVYIVMILDHISCASILSLFYPLSIFLYAIMEYPRPKNTYWNICLLYTVILITIKYIVQLELFVKLCEDENVRDASNNIQNPYKDYLDNIQHYKLGLIFFDTTFSLSFLNYIFFDAVLIIFLLINNYLLLSKGIWDRREQEIESIYQALERISSTKHLNIQTIEDTKSFNRKWLFHSFFGKRFKQKNNQGLFSKQYSTTSVIDTSKDKDQDKDQDKDKEKEIKKGEKKGLSFYKKIYNSTNKEEKQKNQMKPIYLDNYNEKDRTYYQRLFPRIRNEKPGNEYYASYTLTFLSIIIFLILFYTNMNQDKTFNSVSVDTNQFSSSMVIFLIVHVIFLVYDRVIFISQNRNNLIYDYIIYDKSTCAPITETQFNQIKSEISLRYSNVKRDKFFIPTEYIDEIQDKYNIVYIQTEEFNYPLFQKYLLHIIITIFSHIFIFFYLPMKGNLNIANSIFCIEGEDCNDFIYNPALIIFYCLYVIYLIGSGLQVKYGFYDLKRKSLLKSGHSSINGSIYAAYKAIPFLYEIKLAIDWTFTSTCLDLFQWNKFESVYDTIFATYCSMTAKNVQLVGQKVKKFLKIGMGGTLSFSLIILLVIPLMLFSSINPTNEINNVVGATLKIDLSIFYQNGLNNNYTLFQNSKPQSIENLFPEESVRQNNDNSEGENEWKMYNYSESIETKNFPKDQIQKIEFFKQSDRNWGLTKAHVLKLINTLGDLVEYKDVNISKIYIVMDYQFERPLPVEARKVSNRIDTLIYDENDKNSEKNITQIEKINEIKNLFFCNNSINVIFNDFYSAPIRLTANIDPKIIVDEKYNFAFNVSLGFLGCKKEEDNDINYLESYFTLEKLQKKDIKEGGLVFHIFSDKVSSSTSGYSVLTFYVSFVLLAGTYVRNFFTGEPQKISLTELPNPESLINLCEGVLVSRYSFDYEQEEKLYYILIELMRSPDYLKILTESSTLQFQKRKELTMKQNVQMF